MRHLIIFIGSVALLACSTTTKNQGPRKPASQPPANISSTPEQTKLFCDNARHFESYYLIKIGYEIGVESQAPPPSLYELMPELSPEKLPLSKALESAIETCKKPSGDCRSFNNTCSAEQEQIKTGILNCIHQTVKSFKDNECPGGYYN